MITKCNRTITNKLKKKQTKKKQKAKKCINCTNNINGYCKRHNSWAHAVNEICTGE